MGNNFNDATLYQMRLIIQTNEDLFEKISRVELSTYQKKDSNIIIKN